jgi:aminoglycoside phosphotransferase family enzyme
MLSLQKENSYPHKVTKIRLEETHLWVFLTGKYAYKIRKGIKVWESFGFPNT